MPKTILNSLVTLSPLTRRKAAANPTTALIAAADFGLRTAELLQTQGLTSESFDPSMEQLSRGYDPAFLLTRTTSRELLQHLVSVLECFRFRAGSYVGSVALFRRIQHLADERPLATVPEFRPVVPPVLARAAPPSGKQEIGEFDI